METLWLFGLNSEDKGDNIDMWMIKITIKANQIDMDVLLISKVGNIQKACLSLKSGFFHYFIGLWISPWQTNMVPKTYRDLSALAHYDPRKTGQNFRIEQTQVSRLNTGKKWMFYFWLPFQLWRLVTCPTCNTFSNGFLFRILLKLYINFWSKSQGKKQ